MFGSFQPWPPEDMPDDWTVRRSLKARFADYCEELYVTGRFRTQRRGLVAPPLFDSTKKLVSRPPTDGRPFQLVG